MLFCPFNTIVKQRDTVLWFQIMKLFIIIATFVCIAFARGISNVHGASCIYVASNFTALPFDCELPDLAYKCRCKDPSFLGTVMTCIEDYYANAHDFTSAVSQLIDTCKAQGNVQLEFVGLADIFTNATEYLIDLDSVTSLKYKSSWYAQVEAALRTKKLNHEKIKNRSITAITEPSELIGLERLINETRPLLTHPVNIPEYLYSRSYKSVKNLVEQRELATSYGLYLCAFWGIIFTVAAIANILQWCCPHFANRVNSTKIALWVQRQILCPQVIKPHTVIDRNKDSLNKRDFISKWNESFKIAIFTLPLRVHALVLICYIVLTIIFCSINHEIVTPNTVFTCSKGQKYVAIADRTGIIATIQLPLVFLFFTRNNLLMNLTGLSYRTFQIYHKWVARVTFILLVLHCSFYLGFVHVRGDYIDRWGLLKWRCANAGFAAIVLTFVIAFFRRFGYEFFKLTHKILLIIFAVGAWFHCITLGWTEYLAVAYAFWVYEYLMRIVKIISSGGLLNGQCQLLKNPNGKAYSIKMTVNHSGWWKPYPGCYCWIYIMKKDLFWQAHPFTVVSATNADNYNQLVFSIRVKDGATKALANSIDKEAENSVRIMIEGPYGNNFPFKQYEEAVLIAGGVGMAVIYSMALDLANIQRARRMRNQINQDSRVSVLWVVPNLESMIPFEHEIDNLKQYADILQLEVFITRSLEGWNLQRTVVKSSLVNYNSDGSHHLDTTSPILRQVNTANTDSSIEIITNATLIDFQLQKGECAQKDSTNDYSGIMAINNGKSKLSDDDKRNIQYSRFLSKILRESNNAGNLHFNFQDKPRLDEEMHTYLKSIQTTPTALIACGPSQMNSDIRVAVSKCLKDGKCVDYFEEELLW